MRVKGAATFTLSVQQSPGHRRSTHWTVRAVASEAQISPTSVHRYFKLFGLQPHRSESFKLSTVAGDN